MRAALEEISTLPWKFDLALARGQRLRRWLPMSRMRYEMLLGRHSVILSFSEKLQNAGFLYVQ